VIQSRKSSIGKLDKVRIEMAASRMVKKYLDIILEQMVIIWVTKYPPLALLH